MFSAPMWFSVIAAALLLDAAIYFQHRILHAVPRLWRVHRMHHADLEFDVTTELRFHPLGILLSMGIKLAVVLLHFKRVHTFHAGHVPDYPASHGCIHIPSHMAKIFFQNATVGTRIGVMS